MFSPHYPYTTLWTNGRNVQLDEIVKGVSVPQNQFEQNLFEFIRDWSHHQTFELQTSGSTGEPKRIHITKEQMIYSAKQTELALSLIAGSTALLCLDPKFIAGKMMLVRSFVTGMKIIAITPAVNFFDQIPNDMIIDFTAMVPYQLLGILESDQAKRLDTIKSILVGGAPLTDDNRVQSVKANVYATYGMTETISHIALRLINGKNSSDYFMSLPGISLTQDHRNCLVINAPHLPEKVITNDIVELKNPLEFKWLGRWDNIINSGGVKIIPEKVETIIGEVLRELQWNFEFFIAGMPDAKLGQKVVLIVKGNMEIHQREKILSILKKKLLAYEVPKSMLSLPEFTYTESGKVSRSKTVEILQKQP